MPLPHSTLRTRSLWITCSLPDPPTPASFYSPHAHPCFWPVCGSYTSLLSSQNYLSSSSASFSCLQNRKSRATVAGWRVGAQRAACILHIIHQAWSIFAELRSSVRLTGPFHQPSAPGSFPSLFPRPEKHLCMSVATKSHGTFQFCSESVFFVMLPTVSSFGRLGIS